MDTTLPRSAFGGRVPFRSLVVLAVLAALLAASLAFYFGSQKRLPPAFGPAANGDVQMSNEEITDKGTSSTNIGATGKIGPNGGGGSISFGGGSKEVDHKAEEKRAAKEAQELQEKVYA